MFKISIKVYMTKVVKTLDSNSQEVLFLINTFFFFSTDCQEWGLLSRAVTEIVHPKAKPTLPMIQIAFKQNGLPKSFADMMEYTPHFVDLAMQMGVKPPGKKNDTVTAEEMKHYLILRGNEWVRQEAAKEAVAKATNAFDPFGNVGHTKLPANFAWALNKMYGPQSSYARRVADIRNELMDTIAESPLMALGFGQGFNPLLGQGLNQPLGLGALKGMPFTRGNEQIHPLLVMNMMGM